MKQTLFLLAAFALFTGCALDNGDPITKSFPITGNYTGLEVSHAFDVTVSNQVSDVEITVGEKIMKQVVVEVKDGKLCIGGKHVWTIFRGEAKAVIPANFTLNELDLSGASSFSGDLSGNNVDVDISGSSDFYGNVNGTNVDFDITGASSYRGTVISNKFNIDLSGASKATVGGTCQTTMDIELSGSSDLHAEALHATDVTGSVSGSSGADVTCCNSLTVNVSGSSVLTYSKSSDDCNLTVNCTTSGSSSVRPR